MDWKNARLYFYGEDDEYMFIKDCEGDIVAKSCTSCKLTRPVERFRTSERGFKGLRSQCKDCFYVQSKREMELNNKKRRAKLRNLRHDFTLTEQESTWRHFGGCCLTGEVLDVHWDHAIPVAVGHGGTTVGNMLPMRADLNGAKKAKNIFEWFYKNKKRFNLTQSRFDATVEYLAKLNGMTSAEYRDYVYYCHANPRDVADTV